MKYLQIAFFPAVFVVLVCFAFASTGVYDPGDGVMHYLFARYAPSHPYLFLDHWGKPVYILLSSPFAHFGYIGSMVFNLSCLTMTGWFAWRTAHCLKIPHAWFAAPLCIFAPIALPVGMSGLTEPLFAFTLTLGIFLVVKGHYRSAALLISFLPFVRTEGFFLAPLFAIFFLLRKDFISTSLLATGTLLYSLAGWFHYHDLLWVIHENPYKGASTIYGHGDLFHFISLNEFIWGWALDMLLIAGCVTYFLSKKIQLRISQQEWLLVFGIFFLFLAMHSVFWWKGLFGSLGLHRVFVCTIPLAVLIGMRGLQAVFTFMKSSSTQISVLVALLSVHLFLALRQHPLPVQYSEDEKTMMEANMWLGKNKPGNYRVICAYPYLAAAMHRDPFDETQWKNLWGIAGQGFHSGDILAWDSRLAAGSNHISLAEMHNDPRFNYLATFGKIPSTPMNNSPDFGMVLFEVK